VNATDTAPAAERQRMFFALWPEPAQQALLGELAKKCAAQAGGRAVARENIHLTLAFLGEIGAETVAAVTALAQTLAMVPFTLTLDRVGFWRRNGIVWAGSDKTPVPLADLVGHMTAGLARLGFRAETRPYAPHLTLVRRGRRAPKLRLEPVHWEVKEFCLVRSRLAADGAHYEVVDQWPQGAG
jgi:2'-5' RNA ligase